HAVAWSELVDGRAERRHRAGPLVARRELAERRLVRERMGLQLQVRAAGAAHGDFDEDLAGPWLRDGFVDNAQIVRSEEDGGPHATQRIPSSRSSGPRGRNVRSGTRLSEEKQALGGSCEGLHRRWIVCTCVPQRALADGCSYHLSRWKKILL